MIDLKEHLIIGVAGKHQSGKTTIANKLVSGFQIYYNLSSIKTECGDTIADFLNQFLGADPATIQKNKNHPVVRDILEVVGPSYRRHMSDISLTIDTFNGLLETIKTPTLLIFSGIRLLDEAKWIKDHNGILIMVRRPRYDAFHNILTEPTLSTEAELESIGYTYVLNNDNSMILFLKEIDYLIDSIVSSSWFESKTTAEP